jgi:hypothetical protein
MLVYRHPAALPANVPKRFARAVDLFTLRGKSIPVREAAGIASFSNGPTNCALVTLAEMDT